MINGYGVLYGIKNDCTALSDVYSDVYSSFGIAFNYIGVFNC